MQSLHGRRCGQACVQHKHHGEQYSADIKEISRQWHALLHHDAAPASRLSSGTDRVFMLGLQLNVERSRHQQGAVTARRVLSAPADAIHRTAAVRGRAYTADPRGRYRACDRPRAQHDPCPCDAARRILDTLAVNDGARWFRHCGHEGSNQATLHVSDSPDTQAPQGQPRVFPEG